MSDKEWFFKFYKDHKLESTATTRLGKLVSSVDCDRSKSKRGFKASGGAGMGLKWPSIIRLA